LKKWIIILFLFIFNLAYSFTINPAILSEYEQDIKSIIKLKHKFNNSLYIEIYTQTTPPHKQIKEWDNQNLYLESLGFKNIDNIYNYTDMLFIIIKIHF
jgi:hypothetical protein